MSKGFTNLTQFTILPIHSACVSTRNVINVKILREKKYLSKVENIFIIVSELFLISFNYSTVFGNIRRVMAKKNLWVRWITKQLLTEHLTTNTSSIHLFFLNWRNL